MPRVATYVFLDTETTGLPGEEINRTRITEVCFLAVKRDHLDSMHAELPRVQHKLTLCLYPRRRVSEGAARLTGLTNELLEHEPVFNLEVHRLLNSFLSLLAAPVCLIAHNGLGFDYPILRNHLQKLAVGFPDDLLCADSFHGFYDILEKRKLSVKEEMPQSECEEFIPQDDASPSSLVSSNISSPVCKKLKLSDENPVDSASPSKPVEDDFYKHNLNMKAINEATPKKNKRMRNVKPDPKLYRRLPWAKGFKPEESYKLEDVYMRVLSKNAQVVAHRAENDCLLALEISAALSEEFAEWVDANCVLFSAVKPMTPGVVAAAGVVWGCSNPYIRAGSRGLCHVKAATRAGQALAEARFLLQNWRYVVAWLVNQVGSVLYVWGVQRAPLSLAVPLANGLAFACTALLGALSGHDEPLHAGSILGIALIVAGIALCCLDKTS